jgi:5,10-methylenetetrahydrofolate reductase
MFSEFGKNAADIYKILHKAFAERPKIITQVIVWVQRYRDWREDVTDASSEIYVVAKKN